MASAIWTRLQGALRFRPLEGAESGDGEQNIRARESRILKSSLMETAFLVSCSGKELIFPRYSSDSEFRGITGALAQSLTEAS
jgi:hypothetical protein